MSNFARIIYQVLVVIHNLDQSFEGLQPKDVEMAAGMKDLVNVNANIGLDEIATIKVAKVDRELCAARDELAKKISDGKRNLAQLKKELASELMRVAEEKFGEKVKALNDAMAALKPTKGMGLKIASAVIKNDEISVALVGKGSFHIYGGSDEMAIKMTDVARSLNNSILAETEEVTSLGVKQSEVMRRRAELPAVERQIKAAIVTNKLGETQEGRDLLKSLENGDFESILGLPMKA